MAVGWREWAALPDLGVNRIIAKIDTGAKTSAIHAFRLREFLQDGAPWVEFYLHPVRRRKTPEIHCIAPIADKRAIKSSNGASEERIVVNTRLRLGGRIWRIELSLTNRDAMGYRLLIGRDAIRKKAIIDPGASFLLGEANTKE